MAVCAALAAACNPQNGAAASASKPEMFKSEMFMTWEAEQRAFYIRTSVGMASLVIAQSSKKDASCIDGWYFGDEDAANAVIYDAMIKNPDYHPRGVLLAVIEKQCAITYD